MAEISEKHSNPFSLMRSGAECSEKRTLLQTLALPVTWLFECTDIEDKRFRVLTDLSTRAEFRALHLLEEVDRTPQSHPRLAEELKRLRQFLGASPEGAVYKSDGALTNGEFDALHLADLIATGKRSYDKLHRAEREYEATGGLYPKVSTGTTK